MKNLIFGILMVFFFCLSCEEEVTNTDLASQIVGQYKGVVTLKIGSPEANDIAMQQFSVEKIDENTVSLTPVLYPETSPVDTLSFEASLTATPLGFINTEGSMLTIATENFSDGTVGGTPFSLNSVQPDAHGKYDLAKQELVFALEITRNGISDFEFFVGTKK